jgi:DNA-binding response OmpR family regulator/two-component sensor histidine kinase
VLCVIVDVSERRHNERMKDEFVSTVSHELRTPLTSIAGSLGLLAGGAAGPIAEPTLRLLKIAHKNSERLVRLINDILDIEKIESGKIVFDLKQVDLPALVEQAIEGSRGFAESFGVRVRLEAAPACVRADADRLVQVVTNLLSNAVKFSPRDGEVAVAIQPRDNMVDITVTDCGPGIPEDFRSRVFDKFAQADNTDARQKGGTGLGLSIVRQIVTLLGGQVTFSCPPGGGTTFRVSLPRWDAAADDATPAAPRLPHMLICDDDSDVAATIAARLQMAGFSSDIATSAHDALAMAQAGAYDAVLVDLKLPGRDGVSLIQDLRAQPRYHNTPIVVISADAARGRSDLRSASLNVLDWLNKPIDVNHLVEVLGRPLARGGAARPRILHVDDDASVLAVVAEALSPNCDLVSVPSIASARGALAAGRFDLAVLDLVLSQASGLDLLPSLRDRDGTALPVILYSARAANGKNAETVQAALTKSHASIDHLIATLRRHVALGDVPATEHREVA